MSFQRLHLLALSTGCTERTLAKSLKSCPKWGVGVSHIDVYQYRARVGLNAVTATIILLDLISSSSSTDNEYSTSNRRARHVATNFDKLLYSYQPCRFLIGPDRPKVD